MTYAEKLRDPRWQRKRLEIMQRDNFTCRYCEANYKTLHIHHLEYQRFKEPWDYSNEWLITLCESCHQEVNKEREEFEKKVKKAMRLKVHDPLAQFCLLDLLDSDFDFGGLFFLLSNLKEIPEEAIALLNQFWLEKRDELHLLGWQSNPLTM